ncbi:hypothetical protein GX50_01423 [[Emmonsia] crescens]|uniref:Uncharacterized protein n=1 Tax=[Emmonsia] crescens TaxID=73230 RepID=A0A2B7ZQX7_9EURO|nr:hypothetical protein GX50_01423 [Emmonsia crescens]
MMHLYSIIDLVSDDVRPSDTMFNQFPRPTRVAHFASPRLMNAQLESAKISQYSFTPVLEAGSGCGGKWRSHPQSLAESEFWPCANAAEMGGQKANSLLVKGYLQ